MDLRLSCINPLISLYWIWAQLPWDFKSTASLVQTEIYIQPKYFWENIHRNIFQVPIIFLTIIWFRKFKSFFMEDKNPPILHTQYQGCWCPGDASCQDISSHDIDLAILEYSDLSIRRVKCNLYGKRIQSASLPIPVSPLTCKQFATCGGRGPATAPDGTLAAEELRRTILSTTALPTTTPLWGFLAL